MWYQVSPKKVEIKEGCPSIFLHSGKYPPFFATAIPLGKGGLLKS